MANIKKIRLSAGHGAGRAYNRGGLYFNEGDENYIGTSMLTKAINKTYVADIEEIRAERGNTDYSLGDRSRYGNGADLFYSWHSNAGGGNGVEVILSYQSLGYIDFARDLCRVIAETLKIQNRGVKFRNNDTDKFETYRQANRNSRNWYGELNGNNAKCAMIVEHFFHDSVSDSTAYLANKQKLIDNIARCIAYHFGLPKKNSTSTQTTQTVNVAKNTTTTDTDLITITKPINIYMTADSANDRTNIIDTYLPGEYYIYKKYNGMLNISKKKGSAGAWINPNDITTAETNTVNENWQVTDSALNVRDNHTNGKLIDVIYDHGIYRIIEKKGNWGKRQIGGWIHKSFTRTIPIKSNEAIAKEVINGFWGNGDLRKKRLKQAGYDYTEVQNEVNKLL